MFLLLTVLIDTIGFGIVIPVLPSLLVQLTGADLGVAARYGGSLLFLFALLQFFAAPVLGNLSDAYGRRPVLLLSLLAYGLDYLVMGFAPTVAWLFVGRAFAGVFSATYPTATAYMADVSTPAERAKNFGRIGAAWGVGFVLGPALGGVLGQISPRLPFFAAAGLALLNVTYGYFSLPESLPPARRRPFELSRANPFSAVAQIRRYPNVLGLLFALLLFQIAHDSNPSTFTFFTIERFHWSPADIGYAMAAIGTAIAIVQGALIGPVVARLGEKWAAYLGFSLITASFLGYSLATRGWMIYAFTVPLALGTIGTTALKALMSRRVPENSQGELQGAVASLMSLTAIGSPLLMTQLFAHFTETNAPIYFPGAPFFAAAMLSIGCLAVSIYCLHRPAAAGAR